MVATSAARAGLLNLVCSMATEFAPRNGVAGVRARNASFPNAFPYLNTPIPGAR